MGTKKSQRIIEKRIVGTDEHRDHSCTRKRKFIDAEEAKINAKKVRKLTKKKMNHYRCMYCKYWHIGTDRSKKLKKLYSL